MLDFELWVFCVGCKFFFVLSYMLILFSKMKFLFVMGVIFFAIVKCNNNYIVKFKYIDICGNIFYFLLNFFV